MSKLYRSMLWSGLVVAGAAACGDDVTVAPPPTPTVRSISVAPNGVTVGIGANIITFSAAVNADAGVTNLAVTWSTSDATKATISQTGQVTTLAAGSVAIIACSQLAPSVCGNATLNIATGAVTSVTVTPANASFVVGQPPVTFTASVQGTNNPAQTVTWSTASGASTVVSVGATTGIVTIVGAGTEVVRACATAAPTVCGSASVTVSTVASTPAVISIKSITVGNTITPVILTNVAGQIDVTLNLDAGTQTVTNVQVLIDGVVACQQGFSGIQAQAAKAQAAALLSDSASAALVVEIVCSINTAAFDNLTGVPLYFNGPRLVSARVNLVGSAPVATPSTTLIFNNQSGFVVLLTSSNAPDANSAINPITGLQWLGGSVTVSFIGVSYVAGGVTISNASFPLFGKTISAALTAGLGSVTFTDATTWSATNLGVGNYLSPKAGEPVPVGTAVLSDGQTVVVGNAILNLGAAPAGSSTLAPFGTIRLDNVGPGATPANPDDIPDGIAQLAITNAAMAAVWVNAATSFAAGNAALGVASLATLNASTAGVDVEEGVDAIAVTFFATAAGAALPAGCSTTGLTAITLGSQLVETTISLSYRVRVIFKDALGNVSCASLNPGGVPGAQFGADFTAPTGTVTAGPAAGPPGLNVDPGNFSVTASDNASGFLATPLLVIMSRLNVGGTTTCVIGSGTGCVTPAAQALTFDATGAAGIIEGYYTTSITLVDQAGNQTVLVTARLYEIDVTVPGFAGGISLPALIAGAATNTFLATATDNLDLNAIFGNVTYPLATLQYPSQTIGAWGPPLETSVAVAYAVANWVRCINAAGSFAVASGPPTGIALTVSDQTILNATTLASAAFGANAQPCVDPPSAVTGSVGNIPAASILSFIQNAPAYGTGLTQVDIDGAGVVAPSSTTVTLTAVADVALSSSADPFTRVDFFYLSGGVQIKIGTATVVLAQTSTNRTYTYTVVWDPDAAVPVGAVTVVALGVDALGDAVLTVTQTVTTVP